MKCRLVTIQNSLGLHARASAKFVNTASGFSSEVTIRRNGQAVNGKSIMGIMMLAAAKGSQIEICADGADEDHAVDDLCLLVNDRFGEEN
ncbi:MAG: HPr family phosphocarrier protein [Gammaproteobacteria bacterium]|nr:HPr family phosphocarrier protein [Gammaproteobacteria bacterium]